MTNYIEFYPALRLSKIIKQKKTNQGLKINCFKARREPSYFMAITAWCMYDKPPR